MRWRTVGRVAATVLVGLVAPGAVAAEGLSVPERLAPVYLHDRSGFPFDAALGDIAATRDVATARWVAKPLQYRPRPRGSPARPGPGP